MARWEFSRAILITKKKGTTKFMDGPAFSFGFVFLLNVLDSFGLRGVKRCDKIKQKQIQTRAGPPNGVIYIEIICQIVTVFIFGGL